MERFEIIICGTKPLLMNRMSPEALEQLRDKTSKKAKTATKPSCEEEAASKVYMVDGAPVIPVENFMSCLIEAGTFIRLDGKRQLTTSQKTLLPGLLSIESETLWLKDPKSALEPSKWSEAIWHPEMRQGRNPNGGEAVAIVRPRFDRWGFKVVVQMDTDTLPESTYRQLFEYAGSRVGIGDFRPQRKGIFGQFRLDLWQVQDTRIQEAVA